jgi:hypothetical protein
LNLFILINFAVSTIEGIFELLQIDFFLEKKGTSIFFLTDTKIMVLIIIQDFKSALYNKTDTFASTNIISSIPGENVNSAVDCRWVCELRTPLHANFD